MPPQISEDDASRSGSESETAPEPPSVKVKQEKKTKTKVEGTDQDASLMVESDNNEEDDEESLGDEEYIVEKITNHLVDDDGVLRFEVKWEGYEKKSERTWEPEENLETAEKVLNEYLESVGGREEIFRMAEEQKVELASKKGKKRARSSTGVDTSTNGTKRGRKPKSEHPLDSTPPASAVDDKNFAPPTGNWEEQVKDIDACEGQGGVPIVFITWKSGHKSQHPLHQVYKRCPQKMLQFYERHLVFKRGDS